jgi:hypothetical protein
LKALVGLFGPDDADGIAWSLLHVIEAAPAWLIKECLQGKPSISDCLKNKINKSRG